MPARLNMNPIPYIKWKGKTLTQITGHRVKNGKLSNMTESPNLFIAQPLKIYRKEIATGDTPAICNHRNSVSIDEMNMPNGYVITEHISNHAGLVHVIEDPTTNNVSDSADCKTQAACIVDNARRRVRSSGMIKRVFKPENNNDQAYFTNTNQYLVSRNRSFKQNQYSHIRKGEKSLLPNNTQYNTNVYSPNGISHCKTTRIVQGVNDTFYYLWTSFDTTDIAGLTSSPNPEQLGIECYKVVVAEGNKTFEDIQGAFYQAMIANHHYYINTRTNAKVPLLKIIFNALTNKVELQSFSEKVIDSTVYTTFTNDPLPDGWDSMTHKRPTFYFPADNGFASMIGFPSSSPSFYPNIESVSINNEESAGFLSNTPVSIFPIYDIMYYKPSNTRFATQGAVSASDRVLRVKYDTITRNGATYQTTFGCEVPSAMAYNISGYTYRLKDKIGFPNKRTPLFSKYSDEVKCC